MASDNTLVETCGGPIRGFSDGRVTAWKGVRYAAPPIGDLRWRAHEPPESWATVADATRYGFVCPQPVDPRIAIDLGAPQGEDCPTLNVWASGIARISPGGAAVDWARAWEHVLPPLMHDPVTFAVPFFLILLVIEWAAARKLAHTDNERAASGAYLSPDAWASIWMGVVSVGTSAVMNGIALFGYAALYVYVAPWQLPANAWYTWVIAIVGVDFLYYWYHRMAHRVRLFWATHQAHHSSQYFNLATALRQKWNISGDVFLRALLPLFGVPPWMVFASFSINLIYQYWIHTERIGKLWRPIEFVFNTPSHHRVHHGMDEIYLDRNYGGILIIWDRLFRSFQPEEFRPHYGLTKQVDTYNIWKLQTHEYVAIARDVRAARRWRDRLGFVFGPPGWQPRQSVQPDIPAPVTAAK